VRTHLSGVAIYIGDILVSFADDGGLPHDAHRFRKRYEAAVGIAAWTRTWTSTRHVVLLPAAPGQLPAGYVVVADDPEGGYFDHSAPFFMLRGDADAWRANVQLDTPDDVGLTYRVMPVVALAASPFHPFDEPHHWSSPSHCDWPILPPGHPNEDGTGFCCHVDTFRREKTHLPLDCPTAWRLDIEGREHWLITQRRPFHERAPRQAETLRPASP
jgi:hypothetical protein